MFFKKKLVAHSEEKLWGKTGLSSFNHSVVPASFTAPWTVTCQAPLSMGFPRQEYWSGWPFPPPGDLPNPGTKPTSPALAGGFFTTEQLGKPKKAGLLDLQDLFLAALNLWKFRHPKHRAGPHGKLTLQSPLPGKPAVKGDCPKP